MLPESDGEGYLTRGGLSQGADGLSVVGRAEDRRPRDECVGARAGRARDRILGDSAVHLECDGEFRDPSDPAPKGLDLRQACPAMNRWPPKPGLTVITRT